jgi:hypothetical protein
MDAPKPQERKSLWPFYYMVNDLEYANPSRAKEHFDAILQEGLDHYTAPPDLWHNAAMVAGRVNHREAQLALVEAGLREWQDNVDLLCDEFQYRYSSHYDTQKAPVIWQKLCAMSKEKTGPCWRFWVYGAIYYATELYNPQAALELLDEGLKWVRRDNLMDILRNYRRVLVDSIPLEQLDENTLGAYHRRAFKILESRYKLGLELGVENGYVLATELAQLYQEQAGSELTTSPDSNQEAPDQPESTKGNYLQRALDWLDLAERLYTADVNHPVWEIYEARARILMAQRKYGEALRLLRSLPQIRQREPSIATMLRLALLMTGEKIEEQEQAAESLQETLSLLFQNDGAALLRLASDNPPIAYVLKQVAQKL